MLLLVLPLAREWIEIVEAQELLYNKSMFSLLRGSGLKFPAVFWRNVKAEVLPLAREWIEIFWVNLPTGQRNVLPLAREWIEILQLIPQKGSFVVLPLAREWIEIK